jgi:3-phosphoshikimate 1-carboxyvinyltransferase
MQSKSFTLKLNKKIKPFKKSIKVDSDKSLSIRSFLIGSICQDISNVKNVLESDDVFSSIAALRKLGVKIKKNKSQSYKIYGKGLGSLNAKKNLTLDFGNSGTLARLLIGILSTTPEIEIKIKGDKSLNKRNMKKLIELMSEFGAEFLPKNRFNFPLKLISTEMPVCIKYRAGVSAQLKSAVILAGLNSFGVTEIIENKKSRDHTENILIKNSKVIKVKKGKKKIIKIIGKNYLESINMNIPGDPSSAAFFTALTLLNKDSFLKIKNVGLNPTRIGFYELLKKHGAKIKFSNKRKANNEITGDISIKSGKLKKPIFATKDFYEKTTDEFPI